MTDLNRTTVRKKLILRKLKKVGFGADAGILRQINWYCNHVLHDRWPLAEQYIESNPQVTLINPHEVFEYLRKYYGDFKQKRWKAVEPYFKQYPKFAYQYAKYILQERWPDAESTIEEEPRYAYKYNRDFIQGRWKSAEPHLLKGEPKWIYTYCLNILEGRWKSGEQAILDYPYAKCEEQEKAETIYYYAVGVIAGEWPEGRNFLKANKDMCRAWLKMYDRNVRNPGFEGKQEYVIE